MEMKECQLCRSADPIILHNLPYGGAFASLCTPCVLRRHVTSFCPICFVVHNDNSASQSRIMCHRCPATVHLACFSSSTFRYICPQCSNPSFSFFDFRNNVNSGRIVFTKDLAKQLVCAAEIASLSVNKAAVVARDEAERKAMEALLARRRAKEAIERVAYLMANRRIQDEDDVDDDDDDSEVDDG